QCAFSVTPGPGIGFLPMMFVEPVPDRLLIFPMEQGEELLVIVGQGQIILPLIPGGSPRKVTCGIPPGLLVSCGKGAVAPHLVVDVFQQIVPGQLTGNGNAGAHSSPAPDTPAHQVQEPV